MRLAFLTDNYPLSGGTGGIGTYTQLVGEELARLGHDVHVFTPAPVPTHRRRKINGVHLWECPTWGQRREMPWHRALEFTWRYGASDLMLSRYSLAIAVKQATRSGPFDLLESPEIGALGGLVSEKRFAHRFAVRLHKPSGFGDPKLDSNGLPIWSAMNDAERDLALRADVLVAPTASTLRAIETYWKCDLDRAAIVPCPMDAPTEAPKFGGVEACSAVFFGRLEPRKGVDTLAGAVGRVRSRFPRFRATFIGADNSWGDGRTGARVIAEIAARTGGEGAVEVRPPMPRHELRSFARNTSLCVLPSRSETFGIVVAEAMSWGVPAVLSDIPTFHDLAEDRKHCLFADAESPTDFADKMCELLESPDLANRLSAGAFAHSGEWEVERVVPRLLAAWFAEAPGPVVEPCLMG